MQPAPRVHSTPSGVRILTAGHPANIGAGAADPKNLVAVSSWQPYPFPGAISIPVDLRCSRLWFMLCNYVHPMKNYLPNGEIILHYASGDKKVVSLVPPFNLDCYFQHFALDGSTAPFGKLDTMSIINREMATCHADVLEVPCDPGQTLERAEVRATCSEGVIGLAGMTALAAPPPQKP
jgi:hypothetical protein